MSEMHAQPSPVAFFRAVNAYQTTEALRAAIDLDLFTAIGEGNAFPGDIADRLRVSERGTRALADFLVVAGFLEKNGAGYTLAPEAAPFLDRRSQAYMGDTLEFLLSDDVRGAFGSVADCVRRGGTVMEGEGAVVADNPLWVKFARAMAPMMAMPAQLMAEFAAPASGPLEVLDIAAGHGLFGIAVAKRNPEAQIHAVDWAAVLEVARSNAEAAGVGNRHHLMPGSAFARPFGEGYDLALVTNFLHHFDRTTCEGLLRKVGASLKEGGRAAILDFVPNDDRVTPPVASAFSLTMLVTTPAGKTYTHAEIDAMCKAAGFASTELKRLDPLPSAVVLARR